MLIYLYIYISASIYSIYAHIMPKHGGDGKSLMAWRQWSLSQDFPLSQSPWLALQGWTIEQVSQHNSIEDYWCVLHGQVYDLTLFLEYHPGGLKILKPYAGKDITQLFEKYHPWVNFDVILKSCHVGRLIPSNDPK
jgi:cytochrome b involved in lipid metabolism